MLFIQLYFATPFYTSGRVLNSGDSMMNKAAALTETSGLSDGLSCFAPSDGRMTETSMGFPFYTHIRVKLQTQH